MSLAFYLDVHVKRAIAIGLRRRGVDVMTAQEDHAEGLSDADLMSRATSMALVLFSQDADLLAEAHRRQQADERFSGLI